MMRTPRSHVSVLVAIVLNLFDGGDTSFLSRAASNGLSSSVNAQSSSKFEARAISDDILLACRAHEQRRAVAIRLVKLTEHFHDCSA